MTIFNSRNNKAFYSGRVEHFVQSLWGFLAHPMLINWPPMITDIGLPITEQLVTNLNHYAPPIYWPHMLINWPPMIIGWPISFIKQLISQGDAINGPPQ